jgi:glycerol-1-phosphate dehydrogenase [NAD(P)+]
MGDPRTTLERALRDAATTREVTVGHGAHAAVPAIAERCVPGARWMLVADDSTWHAAGSAVQAQLESQGAATVPPLVMRARPRVKPLFATAELLAEEVRVAGAVPVAVGSGVINDLVKHAAFLAGTPYLCVATAASMDGYASGGAALMQDGFKRTLACPPPLAVLADPGVLAAAPARMAAWGYGDLAGKVVAGADWVLADALGVEAINPGPFGLVQDHLQHWLAEPERLSAREPAALARLIEGLLVSGFAMQAHGNSRPASGSDHQFSHLWEMESLQVGGEAAAHGACVGVGCVAMLALYEWLLARPAAAIDRAVAADEADADILAAEIRAALGTGEVAQAAFQEMEAKRSLGSRTARVERFRQAWPELRAALASRRVDAATLQRGLRAAGAAAHPADLGLDLPTLAADYRRARLIRRRYTLLDLLEDLGWLDRAVADLFAPGGFWRRPSSVAVPVHASPTQRRQR